MFPDDILYWLKAQPFKPFRICMNNGRTYDIRHPELIRLMVTSLIIFQPSPQENVYQRAEMIGMSLISHIEPIESAAVA